MKSISKNLQLAALTALLAMAIFVPQNSWSMTSVARKAAVQTGAQIGAEVAPAIYQQAGRLGLTSPQVPAKAGQTHAQRQAEADLQRQHEKRQATVTKWAVQNRARKALDAQKLADDAQQVRSRSLGQRIAGPRSLAGTGLGARGYSPLSETGITRPGVGFGLQGYRSFSSGNSSGSAYAQALENYNNGKTLEEIKLALNPKQPEQPSFFSKLFGGTPQPETPSQSESFILFIKKTFEMNEAGGPYNIEFPRSYSLQFPSGRSLTSQFSPQDITAEAKLIDSIITGDVQQKYHSYYTQAEHIAESSPAKGLTKNEALYFELMKNVLQGKALEVDHFQILQSMAKSLAHNPQKTLDVVTFWEKTVAKSWLIRQKQYQQAIKKDFFKDIEQYKNGQFIELTGNPMQGYREILWHGSRATQKMAEKWAVAPEDMYQPVHDELMEIVRNSNRDWIETTPKAKEVKSSFRFHNPNQKSSIQHPNAQMTKEEITKQFQENFQKYKNGEISFAEMIVTYHPDQAFSSELWRLYEIFTDAIVKEKYE